MYQSITRKITDPAIKVWLIPSVIAAGLILLMLLLWQDGVRHMVSVWRISPAYVHGFVVPVVSAGLIWDGWRKGEKLSFWKAGLLGVAGASGMYGLATLLDIQLGQHLAIVTGIISILTFCFGKVFAIRHRFALGFLFCAVPLGEELIPLLQEITSAAIIFTLNFLDIPAIRQGLLIRTEPGDFYVAEACAGLRFLVGMVVSAILFAHLLLRTWWKQALLLCAAVIVPVLANLVRAVSVVLIGVKSDMTLATGFDHLVYGWGLFAIIFAVLFIITLRASEPGAPARPEPDLNGATVVSSFWALAAAGMILAGSLF